MTMVVRVQRLVQVGCAAKGVKAAVAAAAITYLPPKGGGGFANPRRS